MPRMPRHPLPELRAAADRSPKEEDPVPDATTSLILPRWVIPVEPDGVVLEQHAVAVRDGRIEAILPADAARNRFADFAPIELPEHALIPGLVNARARSDDPVSGLQ